MAAETIIGAKVKREVLKAFDAALMEKNGLYFPFFIDSKDQQRFIEAIVIEIGCRDHNQELEGPQLEIDLSTVPVQSGAHLPHRLYLHLPASYYIQAVSQNLKQIGSFLLSVTGGLIGAVVGKSICDYHGCITGEAEIVAIGFGIIGFVISVVAIANIGDYLGIVSISAKDVFRKLPNFVYNSRDDTCRCTVDINTV